jgi:hypothetical protein
MVWSTVHTLRCVSTACFEFLAVVCVPATPACGGACGLCAHPVTFPARLLHPVLAVLPGQARLL